MSFENQLSNFLPIRVFHVHIVLQLLGGFQQISILYRFDLSKELERTWVFVIRADDEWWAIDRLIKPIQFEFLIPLGMLSGIYLDSCSVVFPIVRELYEGILLPEEISILFPSALNHRDPKKAVRIWLWYFSFVNSRGDLKLDVILIYHLSTALFFKIHIKEFLIQKFKN